MVRKKKRCMKQRNCEEMGNLEKVREGKKKGRIKERVIRV